MEITRRYRLVKAGLMVLFAFAGCAEREVDGREAGGGAVTIVDSILPIEEEVRRFTEAAGPAPTALESDWTSLDALATDVIEGLAVSDTAAFARAMVTPAEFIAFYFPHSVYMAPPYQMDPAIIWFQMSSGSSRGLGRALTRFGRETLQLEGHTCNPPLEQGPNRIHDECVLRVRVGGDSLEVRLFGPVLERDGHLKLLSFGNDL